MSQNQNGHTGREGFVAQQRTGAHPSTVESMTNRPNGQDVRMHSQTNDNRAPRSDSPPTSANAGPKAFRDMEYKEQLVAQVSTRDNGENVLNAL